MIKTVGILGAGQLARMLAQAGQPMGLDFIFLDPAKDACQQNLGYIFVPTGLMKLR